MKGDCIPSLIPVATNVNFVYDIEWVNLEFFACSTIIVHNGLKLIQFTGIEERPLENFKTNSLLYYIIKLNRLVGKH